MRFLSLVCLASLSAGVAAAAAQEAPHAAPGVKVTKSSWRREVRNNALDEDPLLVNQQHRELERDRRDTMKENRSRNAGREPAPLPTTIRQRREDDPKSRDDVEVWKPRPDGITVKYVFEVRITNTGTKAIRALEWGYVLLDPATGNEAGHKRFVNQTDLRPGKSKMLVGHSPSPPAQVINVSQSGKPAPGEFSEHVVIHRIFYEDGTTWERPAN